MIDFTELKRKALAGQLRRHFQGEVRFDATSRLLYSTDASIYRIEPLGVVIPRTSEDLGTLIQIASEMGVSITARGGGTSLSGQSIGAGIVVDCSKYLNAILEIDPKGKMARVQPGVILDQLNRAAAKYGLQFGPDVATASRANLGGMIGNNSSGSRSIVYGKTIDHVRQLAVILADGSRAEFQSISTADWEKREAAHSLEGALYRGVRQVIKEESAEIRQRFPRILRRVSGYNLDIFCEAFDKQLPGEKALSLASLIVGSEGTLGFVTEAELGLLPLPKARGLLVPHFASLAAAMSALSACLEYGPSAVELMDRKLLDLVRSNLSLKETMAAIHGQPAAVFMVEFSCDDAREVTDKIERLKKQLQGIPGVLHIVPAQDPSLREPLWNLRRAALPLLLGMPGDRKPVTFVEDTAVAPERLPEFVARFQEILSRQGTEGAFYGHASVGCLHIRPFLNLKDPEDVDRMRRIAEKVTDLVLEFGGALSGEHGDGLARSEWNRKMFGERIYQAFRRVKRIFDPGNLLNPGKVVDAPAMTANLRYGPGYHPIEPITVFDYSKQQGFVRSIEMCNGSGVCRKLQGGTMCPSFRATLNEKDNTRGRANALREALGGSSPIRDLSGSGVYDVLDLCLMCKACKSECPSNVDMAKLKAEFLQFYYQHRMRPLSQVVMAHIHQLNRLSAPVGPIINWFQGRTSLRWLLERFGGIDRRRSLPLLHKDHFRRWFSRHKASGWAGKKGKVILLDDCFTTFNEPALGRAAVKLLETAGFAVELAGLACCCRPMISKGFLSEARDLVQAQVPALASRLGPEVPLLGLEPSCLLTLTDEWPELLPGPETRQVANAAFLADIWLEKQIRQGDCALTFSPQPKKCLVHGHCHQKALLGPDSGISALRLVPGLDVVSLDTGCCGMAGSFGYEKSHYDLSVKIANLSLVPALAAEPDALVAASGTSCRHQIKDLAGRRALHPIEILAAAVTREGT